jgi:periplasmic mercuric ion binding protein
MKSFSKSIYTIFLCAFMVFGISFSSTAQTSKSAKGMEQTVSFKVTGTCGECKARIESTALDVKGVKKAEWDIQSDMLVLVGSSKMDKQKVADALAKAGHKSELAAADPKGYAKLPGCCQYDSGIEKH